MSTSILNDIKHNMGVLPDDETFDSDIMMFVNGTFSTLTQLGVGNLIGYQITGKDNQWNEFFTDARLNSCKSYIFVCCKLTFGIDDLSGPVIAALERQKTELEFRINVTADYG